MRSSFLAVLAGATGALLLSISVGAQVLPDPAAVALIERLDLPEAERPVRESPRWRKPRKIALFLSPIPGAPTDVALARYRAVTDDIELIAFSGNDFSAVRDADVVIGFCSPELLRAARELRWLHNIGVGVERCALAPEVAQYDFILTNNQRISGPTIAEHTIALLSSLATGMQHYVANQTRATWNSALPVPLVRTDLEGKTMLVAGLGGIGTEIARRAHGLGMKVIATRSSGRTGPDYVDYVGLPDELHALAARADVIVNALPLTRETTALFNQRFFRAVKRGAWFISVGRGQSTVTADLTAALQDGTLAGAGLDVVDPEPLPADHPLWRLPNVIITPHISALSEVASERRDVLIRENLRRYIAGEKLLNVVDLEAGY
ncbi:MAG: D-2-hydroxyacid dehydrogenase [Gammaproteobacteria bacterium]|nr:D-2-hydroxyacid dehydrogenase [Gammaproteobacteria bacterium]